MSRPARHFVARDTCPVCDGTSRSELFSAPMTQEPLRTHLVEQYAAVGSIELEYLEDATFRLVACDACGLVYHAEVPNDALMARIYDVWIDAARAKEAQRTRRDLDARLRFARELALAERTLRRTDEPLKVLDFGMGWGAWCAMALAFGCDTYGHESSPLRIEHARTRGVTVVDWADLPDGRFDLINSEQVFEHLADPRGALEHLVKALAPGGMIKISVPDGRDIRKRLAIGDWSAGEGSPRSLLSVTPLQHVNCFDRSSLLALGARAGLRPAKLSVGDLWAANADVVSPGNLVASLTRPIGRALAPTDTYVFFERA